LNSKELKKVDILLEEYQACHTNRNHYDNIRWTIGSIFIAISLAIFGISFTAEVINKLDLIILLAFFSLAFIFVWYLFVLHVNAYVWVSVLRLHEIEQEFREMGFDVRLHKSIYAVKQILKGLHITLGLFLVFVVAWSWRIAIQWQNLPLYSLIIFVGFLLALLFVLPLYTFTRTNWGSKIKTILEVGKETEIMLIKEQIRRLEEEIEKIAPRENQDRLRKTFEDIRKEIMERIKILQADTI